ncbi:sensor histidine kinase [Cellulomonas composti]|uniref:Two-component sensor histidine kinase n=1 Tax=Cellulomonas composti TaxID=266130 RepID=A0A511JEM3_9CELL|nr:sensor histidine kinase [Cellulomonas composti]GEL96239.1 two-component sensor histidine kinase [Cellulomonas composti]
MTDGREEFWRRSLRAWDIAFWLMVTITAVFSVPTAGSARLAVWSLLGFMVLGVAYVLLGRPGAQRGDTRLTRAYLVVLVLVTTYEAWVVELGIVLLFVAYSQIWFFATSRVNGIVWTIVLTVGIVAATAARVEAQPSDVPSIVGQATLGMVFSIGLGLWVTYVAEQSEERAVLLDDLRATQAQLAASHHAEGVFAERARLAQEIHDTLAQGFTSIVMLAQTTSAELDLGRPERAAERVGQIEAVARDNLAEARALVAAFAPPALADGDLAAALARLGARFEAETGTAVVVETAEAGPVPQDVAVALLRAAQESLANVRRHAAATHVRVSLTTTGGQVQLEVTDDGRGLREQDVEGNGVRGMRERARAGGGELELRGSVGAGTSVRLRLPTGAGDDPHDDEDATIGAER